MTCYVIEVQESTGKLPGGMGWAQLSASLLSLKLSKSLICYWMCLTGIDEYYSGLNGENELEVSSEAW